MALFQKKPQLGYNISLYTLGQQNTLLIVGLGNVGKEYDDTRHNIGFACIDRFAKDQGFDAWVEKKDLKCHITQGQLGDSRTILIKPTTLMNLSGQAVQAVANFYKINAEHIAVVHDELDIPFGQIRTRSGGSSAGHNGVKSVSQVIGEDYSRIRVGIGPKIPEQMDTADFVLQKFSADQQGEISGLTREASAILSEYAFSGRLAAETRSFLL